jgi:hypothetical protein
MRVKLILRVTDTAEEFSLAQTEMFKLVTGLEMHSPRDSLDLLTVAHSEEAASKEIPMERAVLTTLKVFNTNSTMVT